MVAQRLGVRSLRISLAAVGALLVVGLFLDGRCAGMFSTRPPIDGRAFVRFGDVDLPLDTAASGIEAFVHPDDPHITWRLEMTTVNPDGTSAHSSLRAHVPISSAEVRDWSSLPGSFLTKDFERAELFFDVKGPKPVILPDTPATLYAGEHSALNHHRVRFAGTKRAGFIGVEWTCKAYAAVDAAPVAVVARGEVALRSITVWNEDRRLDLAEARHLLGAKFPGIHTDQPKQTSSGFEFPVAKQPEH